MNVQSTTTFKGEYMEYFSTVSVLYLKGNASIDDSSSTLTADEITVYLKEKRALGIGHVQIADIVHLIRGSRMNYYWAASTGTIEDAAGLEPPWRFAAKHVRQTGPGAYNIFDNAMTSCDLEFPHYFFKSSFARMVQHKRVTGLSTTWWTDGLPTFWTPFYTHSLAKDPIVVQIKPGQSKRDGTVIKSNLYYGFPNNNGYVRVIGDYYYKTGVGQGLEIGYSSTNVKGTLYAYHIDDHNPDLLRPTDPPGTPYDKERWKGYLAHWQQLTKRLTMNANVNYLSDPNFNNLFIPEHFEPIVNTVIGAVSSVGLTHTLPWAVTTLSTSRTDTFDPAHNNQFFNRDWALPSLTFTTNPLTSKYLPFNTKINASFTNDIQTENSVVNTSTSTQTGDVQVTLNKGIPLTRSTTLTPAVSVDEKWTRSDPIVSPQNPPSIFINRVSDNTNIHSRLTRWLDLDFGHNLTIRSVQNKFVQNAHALDRGIEVHNITFSFFSSLPKSSWARVSSGYNLRTRDRDEILRGNGGDYTGPPAETLMGTIQERFSSPNAEITINPGHHLQLYANEIYAIFPALHNTLTQTRVSWQPDSKTFLQGAAAYNEAFPGQLQLDTTVNFNLTPSWRIQTTLEYVATGPGGINYNNFYPTQREFKLIRNIHCWQFSLHVIDRLGVRQILFSVQLTTDLLSQKQHTNAEEQVQFYPWRQPWKE